jgi:hypothetical protein
LASGEGADGEKLLRRSFDVAQNQRDRLRLLPRPAREENLNSKINVHYEI